MLMFKEGVKIAGIRPETLLGMQLGASLFEANGYGHFIVTSVLDGKHMDGSLHYKGLAFDLRIWTIPKGKIEEATNRLRLALSPLGFQVVSESNHIHIEFDPS